MTGHATAAQVRSAKNKAVGGGGKRCRKGKACSATCINPREDCLVDMPEPVSVATTKFANMVKQRSGNANAPISVAKTASTAPSLGELSKAISQAREDYENAYGTPNQIAAKAKFDKAVADYERAKSATGKTPLAAAAPPTRGLTPDQNERVDKAAQITDYRLNKRLREGIYSDDERNSQIMTNRQKELAPLMNMTSNEKAALGLYGQDGIKFYQQVNQLLRTGDFEGSNAEKKQLAEFIANNLKAGLLKIPPAQEEKLERAVSGNFATNLGKLKVGDTIQDHGFGSYTNKGAPTLNQFIQRDAPNAVIRVLNPKTARNVEPAMQYQEGEHLSVPGTKYKLVEIQEKGFWSRKLNDYVPTYIFEEVSE